MELQGRYDALLERDTRVIAVSQEDRDLESAARMASKFDPAPRFDLAADLGRAATGAYERTAAYLIDPEGVVRQVFPMIIHARPSWSALIAEVDRIRATSARATEASVER